MRTKAVLLLAHGSSDPQWRIPFQTLLAHLQQQSPEQVIELAYLELSTPLLEDAIQQHIQRGVTNIDIIPLFFSAGRHLRQDVPALLNDLIAEWAKKGRHLHLQLHAPVGMHPKVLQAIGQVVSDSLTDMLTH